jgi:DNA-binding transcriptional regulator YiaG
MPEDTNAGRYTTLVYSNRMKTHEKKRNPASAAIIELRTRLDMTQQDFAVNVLKSAVSTPARWESRFPPHGKKLLELEKLAQKHGFTDLARRFRLLYNQQQIRKLVNSMVRAVENNDSMSPEDTNDFSRDLVRAADRLLVRSWERLAAGLPPAKTTQKKK